jgi:epoxyqueuosine reductase
MKSAIRERALELGFDDCRFTTADPPGSANKFQSWLAQKNHGEMQWLERNAEKRSAPEKILADAKTVIVLAASYADQNACSVMRDEPAAVHHESPCTNDGIVARYAQFNDYHDILGGKLKLLSQFVDELGATPRRSLWYVDTGPILERDLAQRAGLGFAGKHTNLISRKLGNWFFIAEILTTLELAPDAPEKNHCGHCTRCLTACPTNAITAPFQLDARRCISYLTIELKGSIPIELRPLIGNRIFGCDDCLAACPWNRFAREGKLMQPHARPDLRQADLLGLLSLDAAQFKSRFAGSPILRTKRRGLLRNVCVALGNTGDALALPALQSAASDAEPLISEHAQWAMAQIKKRASG